MPDLLAARTQMGVSLGFHIIFAVGAVSGTVLSFELGLLWPRFMEYAGAIIGMPFSLEGFAFFTDAIFLGIYLYGWTKLSPRAHWWAGVAVMVSGTVSGIHAWMLRKDPADHFHRSALHVALLVAISASLLQPLSGDISAKFVAKYQQPAKLAAMEGQFETERGAPLRIGGIPNEATRETKYALEIPKALSFLAFSDFDAEVQGLEAFPEEDWPPVAITHFAFQVMVGLGTLMMLASLWVLVLWWRKREVAQSRPLLTFLALLTPAGFIAVEAGWIVTEVGRQPWIVYGFMRTKDALTPMPGLVYPLIGITLLYLFLGVVVAYLLWAQILKTKPMTQEMRVP